MQCAAGNCYQDKAGVSGRHETHGDQVQAPPEGAIQSRRRCAVGPGL
jgi:hypothetical protein